MADSSLTRRDPLRSLFGFPRFLEDFDDFNPQRGLKIRETDSDIIAEAVVAGVGKENIDVDIEDGVLTVKAESRKSEEKEGEEITSHYQYYYTAALSGGKWDKATAKIKDGVIRITIPKADEVKPRRLTVEDEK